MQRYEHVLVEVHEAVLWIRINRPERRNALSRAALTELGAAFAAFAPDDSIKTVILTGVGNDSFAAGGDLKEFEQFRTAEQAGELFDLASTALDSVRTFPVPVVAAINGWALGGGAELAMACDYRVAAAHAAIGFIHARLNITSGFGGGADLMRVLGSSRALRHALTGKTLGAREALEAGLVDALVAPDASLEQAVMEFIEPFTQACSQVIRGYKSMAIAQRQGLSSQEVRAIERASFCRTWAHDDHWQALASSRASGSRKT